MDLSDAQWAKLQPLLHTPLGLMDQHLRQKHRIRLIAPTTRKPPPQETQDGRELRLYCHLHSKGFSLLMQNGRLPNTLRLYEESKIQSSPSGRALWVCGAMAARGCGGSTLPPSPLPPPPTPHNPPPL